MSRIFTAALLVLLLAACATSAPPSPTDAGPEAPAPSATPSTEQVPSAEPTPSVTPEPAEPSPSQPVQPEGHTAAGLALVRIPFPDRPVSQVFVVEPDGSLRQVTGVSGALGASRPAWSPDGSMIAFGESKFGAIGVTGQIGLVNADGTGERKVAEGTFVHWSPDGTQIVFEEQDDVTDIPRSMYVLDVASGEITDLGIGSMPRWLPDGERISFLRVDQGRVEGNPAAVTSVLYVMSLADGSVEEIAEETVGHWSPDGSAVLLGHEGTLYLAAADGSGARELVDGYDPVWSPDGDRIVFAYGFNQDALPILAVVDLDGNELWSGVVGGSPSWSADGTRLAVEIVYPEPIVQVLDAATGEVLWETDGAQPAWAP